MASRPLLYIHGFGSSGHSYKGAQLAEYFPNVLRPNLPTIPQLAIETLECLISALPQRPLLVGSSLGGFYALYLSQTFDLPAVLVNPALMINALGDRLIGMNQSYFDNSQFEFTRAHLESLSHYQIDKPNQANLLVMVQMADEILDHRKTLDYLPEATIICEAGGNHSFDGFQRHFATIGEFVAAQP